MRRIRQLLSRYDLRPRSRKNDVREEDYYSKARIVAIALVMGGITASYSKFLDYQVLRARRFQGGIENGNLAALMPTYVDPRARSEAVFNNKIQIDILEEKSLKDLWMISNNAVDRTYTQYYDRNVTEVDSNGNPVPGGNVYFVYSSESGDLAYSLYSEGAQWGDYLLYDEASNTYS